MNELETRLGATMRRHDAEAPSAAEIAALRPHAPAPPRHPARLVAIVAVTALVVAGAGIAGLQWRHRQPQPTQPSLTGAVIFVIGTPGAREGALEPVGIATPSNDAATLEALFAYRSTAGRSNPWSGVTLDSLVHRGGLWRVDIDRAPSWTGNDPEAVMQSLAWTLSTATESTDAILVTVGGKALLTPQGTSMDAGYPSYGYLGQAGRQTSWPRRVCGSGQYVAESGGHRWTMRANDSDSRAGPARARMTVDTALRVLTDGLCFRRLTVGGTRLGEHSLGSTGSLQWTPHHAGTYIVHVAGSMCPVADFTTWGGGCLGGIAVFATLRVDVVAH